MGLGWDRGRFCFSELERQADRPCFFDLGPFVPRHEYHNLRVVTDMGGL